MYVVTSEGNEIIENVSMGFDRDEIESYLGKYYAANKDSTNKILSEALIEIIPMLFDYEEESRKIRFDLAVAFQDSATEIKASRYTIKTVSIPDNVSDSTEYVRDCVNSFKSVAKLCGNAANAYILINSDREIEFGLYFVDIEKTGEAEKSLMEAEFILITQIHSQILSIRGKQGQKLLKMAFLQRVDCTFLPDGAKADEAEICKIWNGIFQRVKREVHGSICLIVKEEWELQQDDNWGKNQQEAWIPIPHMVNGISDNNELNRTIDILLNMMDADGVTVLDINGVIRAYSLFYSFPKSGVTAGGARRRAYEALKASGNPHYTAIYFQSEEGEIEYYDYNEKQLQRFFDPRIMNGRTSNPQYQLVKEHFQLLKEETAQNDTPSSRQLILSEFAGRLMSAHIGFDNFYKEPEPARKLKEFLVNNYDLRLKITNMDGVWREVVNAVFACYVGNHIGISFQAEDDIWAIIQMIDKEVYEVYFRNHNFIDGVLTWELSGEIPYGRWKFLIDELVGKIGVHIGEKEQGYEREDYLNMYYAIAQIRQEQGTM